MRPNCVKLSHLRWLLAALTIFCTCLLEFFPALIADTVFVCSGAGNPDGLVVGSSSFSNFTVCSPPSDGSCLFAVLGHQLGRGFAAAQELRTELVHHIRVNATEMVSKISLVLIYHCFGQ